MHFDRYIEVTDGGLAQYLANGIDDFKDIQDFSIKDYPRRQLVSEIADLLDEFTSNDESAG